MSLLNSIFRWLSIRETEDQSSAFTRSCKYKTGKVLGKGMFAVVKEAIHIESGETYAVKIVSKKVKDKNIPHEISVLKKVSRGHENILSLIDYFETQENIYIVTELAEGGELFYRIYDRGSYFERDAAHIVHSILNGIAYLHENGIVHRDLKPENILFRTKDEESDIVIADFGLARIMDDEKIRILMTECGTLGYIAPEVFGNKGYGQPVDMWAVGVITYFLLCGYCPFDREDQNSEILAIERCDYAFEPAEYWEDISDEAKQFISSLLVLDPSKRMTATEALGSPWLRNYIQASKLPVGEPDILQQFKKGSERRRAFRRVINVIKVVNHLQHSYQIDMALPKDEDIEADTPVTVYDPAENAM
ncbi:putative calmodulin-dependent protein kinase type 1 [Basidiobolus meristosporus CBS 931.73]|uniref:Putative calmodulin-dependent protein kinase type 1 n=1 Tax=Basidiobolus meristosporus CBS 931.73 TaxID=1314790 RepID=A0A1Y1Z8T9_9FUNG|nr:putative calmodulin-dependent protein kinase type 1 [Basidiobolus meristosporus CBS 931.73]|eukprot:ORY06427.1 putative calmodulin-dependent protein kinase type 1 [Basidiobolus meristosporus CBS 931.73]